MLLKYKNMNSYKLGAKLHEDASIGLEVREATCEKSARKLLIKQYVCNRFEEADCLLKEALRQVSDKYAVWAILKDVILSEKDSLGLFTVNFIYEKLQSYIFTYVLKKNDKGQPKTTSTDRYKYEKPFHSGENMGVYNVYDTKLNICVIAKIYGPYNKLEKANKVIKEALVQAIVSHDNVTKILDIWLQELKNAFTVGFVLERLRKDVQRDIAERKEQQCPYNEKELLTFLYQITSTLIHAKKLGIAHRDIKPSNIFIENTGTFKIGDFGSAWDAGITAISQPIFSFEKWTQRYHTSDVSGTILYLSPEMRQCMLGKVGAVDPFASDIYSLGVTVLEMAALEVQGVLNTKNTSELEQAIAIAISSLGYSENFQSLIREMLNIDRKQRCILEKIFTNVVDLLGIKNFQISAAIDSAENALKKERIYCSMESFEDVENYQVQGIAQLEMLGVEKEKCFEK